MRSSEGKYWIEGLRRRWIFSDAVKAFCFAATAAIISATVAMHFLGTGWKAFVLIFLLLFAGISAWMKYWNISSAQVSRFVDDQFPEVEQSSWLVLEPEENLSLLQRLQADRVNKVLSAKKISDAPWKQLVGPVLVLVAAIALSYGLSFISQSNRSITDSITEKNAGMPVVKENIPAEVSGFVITITPPAYTGKQARSQQQFSLTAETGSMVKWAIKTSLPVQSMVLLLNDNESVPLKSADNKSTWSASRLIAKSGFYQIVLNGKKSDYYQMEVTPDLPVAIRITNPAQHSTIDIGQPQQIDLKVLLNDDYGITDASISATMASGKGEAVSFKEKKIALQTNIHNQRSIQISQRILLRELGMKPGDELYFYINAKDNHGQLSRSDTYFVSIQDTTELMSLAGIDNGVNLVPEYFRSQRQLIMDTEKLLKEKAGMSEEEFKNKSNNLGIDQKMLRLRYGKFLGEEEETNIGGGHADEKEGKHAEGKDEHGHEAEQHAEAVEFGNTQAIMDQYAHKHDTSEDATFFEPELKAQLKATLNEMWTAELRLRTYEPQQALPFEYKALRLLKDLQQKSRAYVAKTTFKTSPIKPEKRLTGELKEVNGVQTSRSGGAGNKSVTVLKATLAMLENKKEGLPAMPGDLGVLLQAQQQLSAAASNTPAKYLDALKSTKKVLALWKNGNPQARDIAAMQKGLSLLIGAELAVPVQLSARSSELTKSYFKQLNRMQ
ncbi:DUF4175 family protein [Pedobacter duraquae]|uniref:DUF4175 family protein n=1 Tax=Pedobacter duraquae TaxID=425511 RepID=A0A4R6IL83_9SPHI|nr:DUF4175 family protein [Pedobacter duraquae]TDO22852.1 hypothetical protein CLV32_1837 [Pedobacter duraquae]